MILKIEKIYPSRLFSICIYWSFKWSSFLYLILALCCKISYVFYKSTMMITIHIWKKTFKRIMHVEQRYKGHMKLVINENFEKNTSRLIEH
jgi:hypothetical protein